MPERTFLVRVEQVDSDPASLAGIAEDIHDACLEDGIPVTSVSPWSPPADTSPLTVNAQASAVQI